MIEAYAVGRFQPGSAKKLTLVADLVRGKDVPTALRVLSFLVKPSKAPLLKTLRSAVANAIVKAGKAKLKEEDLVVTEVRVDQGPILKPRRWQPGPRGMATPIRKPTVHILVRVATEERARV
ncbi:50S ribosomal protein L22 [candidate division WOR-3 bacterium]|nr:50S ribosomal protein L22 [candidate division WOR-3 bacterium]